MLQTRYALIALALLIGFAAGGASAQPIAYFLQDYPLLQNGNHVSGTIVTDGTIGTWSSNHIVSWNFITTNAGGTTLVEVQSDDIGATIQSFAAGVVATPFALSVTAGAPGGFILAATPSTNANRIGYLPATDPDRYFGNTGGGGILWNTPIATGTPFIIGAVPEPGTLGALTLLGVGLAARRSRRAAGVRARTANGSLALLTAGGFGVVIPLHSAARSEG